MFLFVLMIGTSDDNFVGSNHLGWAFSLVEQQKMIISDRKVFKKKKKRKE